MAFADHRYRPVRRELGQSLSAFERALSEMHNISDRDTAIDVGLSLDELAELEHLLEKVVRGLDSAHPTTERRSDRTIDAARQELVETVKRTTGKYHDNETSVLIDVAFDLAEDYQLVDPGRLIFPWSPSGRSYSPEAHRQWRSRTGARKAAPDDGAPPQPTADDQ